MLGLGIGGTAEKAAVMTNNHKKMVHAIGKRKREIEEKTLLKARVRRINRRSRVRKVDLNAPKL